MTARATRLHAIAMRPEGILKAIACRLTHTGSWEKRGKGLKDRTHWRGAKTYTYWCSECRETRVTGIRIIPKGRT